MRVTEETAAEKSKQSSQSLQSSQSAANPRQVRVGIVGYGTVGRATAEILASHAEEIRQHTDGVPIVVTRLCRKTPALSESTNGIAVVSDWRQVVNADDVDIVVEAIGGTGVANEVIQASLENGKAVV